MRVVCSMIITRAEPQNVVWCLRSVMGVKCIIVLCVVLLQLNGEDLRAVAHKKAVSAFHRCGDNITLLVEKGAEQRIRVSLCCVQSFCVCVRMAFWQQWPTSLSCLDAYQPHLSSFLCSMLGICVTVAL